MKNGLDARDSWTRFSTQGLNSKKWLGAVAAILVYALLALLPAHAEAAFPGDNGPIFVDGIRDGNPRGIYRMNPDGSNVTRVTPTSGTVFDDPSASADGKKLAVRGCPAAGDCEIYVINADGTGTPVPVTNNSLEEFEPAISPNGTRVAFVRGTPDPNGNNQDVWIANADGTGVQTNLTGGAISPIGDPNNSNETGFVGENAPVFSPDGTKIAFTSDRPRLTPPEVGFEFDGDPEIWVMDADGTDKQQITEDHDPLTPIPFPPGDFAPNFSPDGTKLAWSRLIAVGNFDVVWRNVAGAGAPLALVTRPGNQERPTFSPDGTKIAYLESPPTGAQNIFVSEVNFAGGTTLGTNLTNHIAGQISDNPDWAAIPRVVAPPPGGGGTPTPPARYPVPRAPLAPFANCPASTSNLVLGTAGNNSLVGTPLGDRIFAGAGNDTADGLAGNDCIDLGPGTDRGQGGDGIDLMLGGLGADRLSGNANNDRLLGGASGDRLIGGLGNDRLHGQSGADRVNGERGRDQINGGSSNDVISAGSSNDRAAGDQGNDRLNGNSGNDSLRGNSGRDRLNGGSGRDLLSGGSGNDRVSARDGRRDRINCGSGRDSVTADRIDRVARNCERVRRR